MASLIARSLARSLPRRVAPRVASVARVPLAMRTTSSRLCLLNTQPTVGACGFSTTSNGDVPAQVINSLDENRFLELAEGALDDIQTWIDGIEEMLDESDISFTQGVLKIDLGESGTWVLNRQIPNRQIWWSSPISGPRRYEFDAASGKWLNTRDKTELFERLQNEICEATGISIFQ